MAAAEAANSVRTLSPAHLAELQSSMSTGQALFRRQLEGLRDRLRSSNLTADAITSHRIDENTHVNQSASGAEKVGSAPTLAMIKEQFEQRRKQAAQEMKQLLANVDPSLATF